MFATVGVHFKFAHLLFSHHDQPNANAICAPALLQPLQFRPVTLRIQSYCSSCLGSHKCLKLKSFGCVDSPTAGRRLFSMFSGPGSLFTVGKPFFSSLTNQVEDQPIIFTWAPLPKGNNNIIQQHSKRDCTRPYKSTVQIYTLVYCATYVISKYIIPHHWINGNVVLFNSVNIIVELKRPILCI